MLNRRECLSVLTAACWLPQPLLATNSTKSSLCLATQPGLLPGETIASQLLATQAAGFSGFSDPDLLSRSESERRDIVRLAAAKGLRLGPVRRPIMPGLPWAQDTWDAALLPVFDQVAELGLTGVRLSIGPQWTSGRTASRTPLWSQATEFRQLMQAAEERRLTLLLEPWDDGRGGLRHFHLCHDFVTSWNSPTLQLSLDTQHWVTAGADLRRLVQIDPRWIGHVELADFAPTDAPNRLTPDAIGWLHHLQQSNYRGMMAIRHGLASPGLSGVLGLREMYRPLSHSTWMA